MPGQFSRLELLIGESSAARLAASHVAVFGLGGVGSYAAEALARSGVGRMTIVDSDNVCVTNINRQVIALHSTIGAMKADVMASRLIDINPRIELDTRAIQFDASTCDSFDFASFDYVVDAIDMVSAKLLLIERSMKSGGIISCMGAGNKLDATRFEVADIYQTSVCPLARVIRRECKARGIKSLKVVYSKEQPLTPIETPRNSCANGGCVCPPGARRDCLHRRQVPGSAAWVPPVAGLIAAAEVVKGLTRGLDVRRALPS